MSQDTTPHNAEFDHIDHIHKLKKYANDIVNHEFDDEDDFETIQELIEMSEEIGQLLACYRKHQIIKKGDAHRFKQYCPLCYECIHCDCK